MSPEKRFLMRQLIFFVCLGMISFAKAQNQPLSSALDAYISQLPVGMYTLTVKNGNELNVTMLFIASGLPPEITTLKELSEDTSKMSFVTFCAMYFE